MTGPEKKLWPVVVSGTDVVWLRGFPDMESRTRSLAAFYGGRGLHWFVDGQMAGWFAAILGAAVLVGVGGVARGR